MSPELATELIVKEHTVIDGVQVLGELGFADNPNWPKPQVVLTVASMSKWKTVYLTPDQAREVGSMLLKAITKAETEMEEWEKKHGLPFTGDLIRW